MEDVYKVGKKKNKVTKVSNDDIQLAIRILESSWHNPGGIDVITFEEVFSRRRGLMAPPK